MFVNKLGHKEAHFKSKVIKFNALFGQLAFCFEDPSSNPLKVYN